MKIRNTSGKQPKIFKLDDVKSGQLVAFIDNEHNSTISDWSIKSILDTPYNIFFTTGSWNDQSCSVVRIDNGYIYDVPRDAQVYVYDEPEILISNFKTEEDE